MVIISTLPPGGELQALWQELMPFCEHSFFISWHWLGTWVQCVQPMVTPRLLTVTQGNALVAAGFLVRTNTLRRGVLPIRSLCLNTVGDETLDCISTEYNGLLTISGKEHEAWEEVLEHLCEDGGWDELRLDGVSPMHQRWWASTGKPVRTARKDTSRYIDLRLIRERSSQSCENVLPSDTGRKIRRTRRAITSTLGPVVLRVASSSAEALRFLDGLETLHTLHWQARSGSDGGAFAKPFFKMFHRELIQRCFDSGAIQLARLDAGDTAIGYIYNFVYQGRVYFYQSGFNYQAVERNRSPGILMHAMLIDHNAALGHGTYDFLAGDSNYKRHLSTHSNDLWWGALQMPRLKFTSERIAVGVYRSLRRRFQVTPD